MPSQKKENPVYSMSCYICLEEEGELMQARGCGCKGSVAIHKACFQEWVDAADNPFKCSICKTDFTGSFLVNFLTEEEILLHPMGLEEEEPMHHETVMAFDFHGITVLETDEELLFETEEHKFIYFNSLKRQDQANRVALVQRQKNAMRFQVKAQRRPKWSKVMPFRK
jgi:hypothetical protein